jgi:7SK snRNA methylphosphate capping enzyme
MSTQVETVNVSRNQRNSLFVADNFGTVGMTVENMPPESAVAIGGETLADQRDKFAGLANLRGKRHFSFSVDDKQPTTKQRRYSDKFGAGSIAFGFRRRGGRAGRFHPTDRGERFVLPTKFLLGGSITDPLNLNSLCDEAINRSMNAATPMSSPLPVPTHRLEVRVMVPVNIADPLNLSATDVDSAEASTISNPALCFRKRRKSARKKHLARSHAPTIAALPLEKPLHIEVESKPVEIHGRSNKDGVPSAATDTKMKRIIDHIVSPVIPQVSPKWKRRRTVSETKPDMMGDEPKQEAADKCKPEKTVIVRHKKRHTAIQQQCHMQPTTKFRAKNQRFAYGNYCANRLSLGFCDDPRLGYFSQEMFAGKDVLDVGCGDGHIALSVARDLHPRSVIGVDIADSLIVAAKRNKRHYVSTTMLEAERFPLSFRMCLGPLAAPQLPRQRDDYNFPWNVSFVTADYVPAKDADIDKQLEEYDVIMALCITKWIHLNYGDDGLKRTFRRMYQQLRPGGQLVLEAEPWKSYRKKKKLTERIFHNYQRIQFRPEDFREYLLSREVGFSSYSLLGVPSNRSKGLKNALLVFTKSLPETVNYFTSLTSGSYPHTVVNTASGVLYHCTPLPCSQNGTPDCTSSCCWLTPRFEFGSTSCSTPCSTWCHNTPNGAVEDVVIQSSPFSSSGSSAAEALTEQPLSLSEDNRRASPVVSSESHVTDQLQVLGTDCSEQCIDVETDSHVTPPADYSAMS